MNKCDQRCPTGCTMHTRSRKLCESIEKGTFMTLGPSPYKQCQTPATWWLKEKGYKRRREGKMPLCDSCLEIFKS